MSLEGKIVGYNKKMVVYATVIIIVSGLVFYAGAQYEKHKLASLGLAKSKSSSSANGNSAKKSSKKNQSANSPVDSNTPASSTPDNSPSSVDASQNSIDSNIGN